jgi:hypothetical protein
MLRQNFFKVILYAINYLTSFSSDVGVYGLVELDKFEGRDETIRNVIINIFFISINYFGKFFFK